MVADVGVRLVDCGGKTLERLDVGFVVALVL